MESSIGLLLLVLSEKNGLTYCLGDSQKEEKKPPVILAEIIWTKFKFQRETLRYSMPRNVAANAPTNGERRGRFQIIRKQIWRGGPVALDTSFLKGRCCNTGADVSATRESNVQSQNSNLWGGSDNGRCQHLWGTSSGQCCPCWRFHGTLLLLELARAITVRVPCRDDRKVK